MKILSRRLLDQQGKLRPFFASATVGLLACTSSDGVETLFDVVDDPSHCDLLFHGGSRGDEIGRGVFSGGPFPADEELLSEDIGFGLAPCPAHDDPNIANPIVEIVNLTGKDWPRVFYVANQETLMTNWDGFTNGLFRTFEIDGIGMNTPLIFESDILDGIWQPGEAWQFIIQDYTHPRLPPSAIDSIRLGFGSQPSSGSIVVIPEPSQLSLVLLGIAPLMVRRRRAA